MAYDPPTNDVRERLQEIARTLQTMLPMHTGFALLCFDFGAPRGGSRLEYISNAQRPDIVQAMREWIAKTEAGGFATHQDTGLPLRDRQECIDLVNAMAVHGAGDPAAAAVAQKAQVVTLLCDFMADAGIPANAITAEALQELAQQMRNPS